MRAVLPGLVVVAFLASIGIASVASSARRGAEIDLGDWEEHIAQLQRRLDRDPRNPNHYLRVAQAYAAIGETDRVVEYTEMARDHGAHPAQAYLLLGDHYLKVHRFERAMQNYDRALRVAPRNVGAWAKAWRALYELRRSGKKTTLDVRMFANDLQTHGFYFPVSWRDRGQVPSEDPQEAGRRTAMGYRLLDSGDMPGAIRAFRRALDSEPTFADAFRGLGIAHARSKRLEKALGAYTLFTELARPGHKDIPKIRKIILDYYEASSRRRAGR
jgi:tetratricopeptide (TPR) repeat protein